MEQRMKEATELVSQTVARCLVDWSPLDSFRWIAQLGLRHAEPEVLKETTRAYEELVASGELDGLLVGPEGPIAAASFIERHVGGIPRMAASLARRETSDFERAVDAASLVFAHALLEAAVLDYCRATALVSPESWQPWVRERKITLEALQNQTYSEVLKSDVEDYVSKKLERDSLMKKLDTLMKVCKGPEGMAVPGHYEYDRKRIERLDALRHDVAHGRAVHKPLPGGDDDIKYLKTTALRLAVPIRRRFNVAASMAEVAAHTIGVPVDALRPPPTL